VGFLRLRPPVARRQAANAPQARTNTNRHERTRGKRPGIRAKLSTRTRAFTPCPAAPPSHSPSVSRYACPTSTPARLTRAAAAPGTASGALNITAASLRHDIPAAARTHRHRAIAHLCFVDFCKQRLSFV
jgi:hypothetical protein